MADDLSEVPVESGRDPRDDVRGPVTIADIAESAGVSVPTVSKVLNGRSGVSDGTRARVEELINRYGYRKPSASRNTIVELVFRELDSLRAAEIIRGVGRVARKNRMGVMVSEIGLQDSSGRTWSEVMERRPHCVLSVARLSDAERDRLSGKDIPFVVFDPVTELPDDVPFVGTTNWRGGRSATRHLIELGHRRIAMIGGPKDMPCFRARSAGYGSALEGAGLPVDSSLIIYSPLTLEEGCAAARELLTRRDRPTAVFAASDLQALGVYKAARELALHIPDDLSVVGFGDLPAVAWAEPPMTTVRQPLTEMAMAATELALALGRGEEPAQVGLEIATTLTVRNSTAPPAE